MADPVPRLQLSLACWDYDRTRALADGSVRPEGIDLIYHELLVEETFFRMLRNREFDAAEMSLSSYCVSLMRDDPAFIAIPVFPSRFFRHSCIFVSTKSSICGPKELAGKRIGVPEFQIAALHTARAPSTFATRPDAVKRLVENYVEIEKAYYRKTRIFPIMHTVVIRREL